MYILFPFVIDTWTRFRVTLHLCTMYTHTHTLSRQTYIYMYIHTHIDMFIYITYNIYIYAPGMDLNSALNMLLGSAVPQPFFVCAATGHRGANPVGD